MIATGRLRQRIASGFAAYLLLLAALVPAFGAARVEISGTVRPAWQDICVSGPAGAQEAPAESPAHGAGSPHCPWCQPGTLVLPLSASLVLLARVQAAAETPSATLARPRIVEPAYLPTLPRPPPTAS